MEYTKGEWKAYQVELKPARWVVCGKSGKVGIVKTALNTPPQSEKEKEANAHLIAAAPAMYEALKSLMPDEKDLLAQPPLHGRWDVSGEALEKGRLALAKAEGKQEVKK